MASITRLETLSTTIRSRSLAGWRAEVEADCEVNDGDSTDGFYKDVQINSLLSVNLIADGAEPGITFVDAAKLVDALLGEAEWS